MVYSTVFTIYCTVDSKRIQTITRHWQIFSETLDTFSSLKMGLHFLADTDLGLLKRGCTTACTNWKRKQQWLWLLTESNTPLRSFMIGNRDIALSFRTRGKMASKYLINSSKCHWDVPVRELWCLFWKIYWNFSILFLRWINTVARRGATV